MKRVFSLLLVLALTLSLAACGDSSAKWQERYDLGQKYLTEGNYEEAILAFTAAIEIDPKNPEAYLGLADAYMGTGDRDAARKALEDGLSATGDAKIQERLDKMAEENAYGGTEFTCRSEYRPYEDFSAEDQRFIAALAEAAIAGDVDAARGLLGYWQEEETATIWNGYKLEFSGNQQKGDETESMSVNIQMRPENGMGYYLNLWAGSGDLWEARDVQYITCPCADWQWNGELTDTRSDDFFQTLSQQYGETHSSREESVTTGMVVNGLRSGTFTNRKHYVEEWSEYPQENEDTTAVRYLEYQDGRLISTAQETDDPDTWEKLITFSEDHSSLEIGKIYAICSDQRWDSLKNWALDVIYW